MRLLNLNRTAVLTVLCSKATSSVALSNETSSRMFASSRLLFQHLDSTESTQDVAKQTIPSLGENQILAVTATEQTKGRGTSGREWVGLKGNVFLTVAFQSKEVPTTLTLLPLQVGILVAERIDKLLNQVCAHNDNDDAPHHQKTSFVKLKWPNDVLLRDQKVAGVLIESMVINGNVWLIVGIGVNLAVAPQVPQDGPNRGRPATSVQSHCTKQQLPDETAQIFATDFTEGLVQWLESPTSSSQKVLADWKKWANFGQVQLVRETNERVIPVDIKEDGQLVVRGEDGRERLLAADYLY